MSKYKDTEQDAFVRIRATMIDWKDSTIRFASVVAEAKEREIWKVKKYDTFEDFCQIECGITRQWANKLVLANKVMLQIATFDPSKPLQINKNLETAVSKPGVSIDAAIELAKVPSNNRQTVLQQATATGQPLTAKTIAQAADQTLNKSRVKEESLVDDTGFPIPTDCIGLWKRSGEIQDLMTAVSRVKTRLDKARAEDDVLFRTVSQAATNELALAYSFLANAKPYAVCLYCQGRMKDNCRACKGTGLMARFAYEHEQVKGLRTIREAGMKKGQ